MPHFWWQCLFPADPDGDPVSITITGITSDEPTTSISGAGGGIHAPDAYGVGTSVASLGAERSGKGNRPEYKGNGRVYRINFSASDGKVESPQTM